MTTLDILRNSLIDRIIATNNEKLLSAIANIFESTQVEEKVQLSSEQIEMLMKKLKRMIYSEKRYRI